MKKNLLPCLIILIMSFITLVYTRYYEMDMIRSIIAGNCLGLVAGWMCCEVDEMQ